VLRNYNTSSHSLQLTRIDFNKTGLIILSFFLRKHNWKKWGGLKGLKALEPKKWGGLEPSSLIEVYAYAIRMKPELDF